MSFVSTHTTHTITHTTHTITHIPTKGLGKRGKGISYLFDGYFVSCFSVMGCTDNTVCTLTNGLDGLVM